MTEPKRTDDEIISDMRREEAALTGMVFVARSELQAIRTIIGAHDEESTVDEVTRLVAQIKKLREALRHYVDMCAYHSHHPCDCLVARAALGMVDSSHGTVNHAGEGEK